MKRVRAIVLCEGSRDVEALKSVARRLGLIERLENVAVTDAEGINTLRTEVLPALLALIVGKVVSKPKPIGIIVDADNVEPKERVEGFISSLESRGYRVIEYSPVCHNVWKVMVKRGIEEMPLLIAVNGVFEDPFTTFETHELEDHLAYLKLLENKLSREEVLKARRAKEVVSEHDFMLLDNADSGNIDKAFSHMKCLLQAL